jgi:hypothetical protein
MTSNIAVTMRAFIGLTRHKISVRASKKCPVKASKTSR